MLLKELYAESYSSFFTNGRCRDFKWLSKHLFFIRNVPPDQLFQVESFLEILKTLLIFPALSVGSEYAI